LVFVGWISYWFFGDSVVVVVILVALIKTLGLTELVSDTLGSRNQKEAETNSKIVDLFKHVMDETKRCVEKEFKLGTRKYEEYKGLRFRDGDYALVVDV